MPWQREDDAALYDTAERMQYHLAPGWLVMWGPGSRRFWAFRRGGPVPVILSGSDPFQLYARVQQHTSR
jgi:hypothetical protein